MMNENMNNITLPTKEEYEAAAPVGCAYPPIMWSEPKYVCDECGGNMLRNEMYALTSNPPAYEYKCDKCGHVDYQSY